MKILVASHLYCPSFGGNQILTQELAEKFAELNEETHVFTANAMQSSHFHSHSSDQGLLLDEEIINGVNVRRFKIQHRYRQWLFFSGSAVRGVYRLRKAVFKDALEFWQHGPYIPQMLSAIKKLKPDVMLALNYYATTTYLCYLAKKNFQVPLIIMPLTHIAEPWTDHPIVQKVYHAADLVITSTPYEKKILIDHGVDQKKLRMIGHGIKMDKFQGADSKRFKRKYKIGNDPIVLYVGRKISGKGIEILIDAMQIVWRTFKNVQLVIAGSKTEKFEPILQDRLNQLQREERQKTFNIDDFPITEKKDIFAMADMFVLASNIDSFGISNMEAWANGLPIICCTNTPQETMIDEYTDGLLVEYGNKEQLAQAILKLLENENLRKKMGETGRRKVLENNTMDIYAQRIKDEIYQLKRSS